MLRTQEAASSYDIGTDGMTVLCEAICLDAVEVTSANRVSIWFFDAKVWVGEAASDKSCQYMIELMDLNELDWWLDAGLPADVYAANKAGWLYEVYDDVGIVKAGDRPYVIAILSKYGSGDVDQGSVLIEDLSRIAWESQNSGEDGS